MIDNYRDSAPVCRNVLYPSMRIHPPDLIQTKNLLSEDTILTCLFHEPFTSKFRRVHRWLVNAVWHHLSLSKLCIKAMICTVVLLGNAIEVFWISRQDKCSRNLHNTTEVRCFFYLARQFLLPIIVTHSVLLSVSFSKQNIIAKTFWISWCKDSFACFV